MCASFGIRVVAGCMPKNGIAGSYGSSIILFTGCAEFLKDSVVVAHGLSCSVACGIFLDQGSNLCLLHWQADSLVLRYQGSPHMVLLFLAFWGSFILFSIVTVPIHIPTSGVGGFSLLHILSSVYL